jgi:hypothetical protein
MRGVITLQNMRDWQLKHLATFSGVSFVNICSMPITIVVWHYWKEDKFDSEFDYIEMAIRETWKHLGLMKTILVVNRITKRIEHFCEQFSGWVKIEQRKELEPGSLYSMSYDAIKNMHRRVDTDYVLNVHPDGWALRPGMEEFIGKYDYIGSPWAEWQKPNRIGKLLLKGGKYVGGVGNGGFSLRSKKLYEVGAWYYNRKYKYIPDCFLFYEDIYYTMFLPSYERMYRDIMHIAPPEVAAQFALEDNIDLYQRFGREPLGFHSWRAFARLVNDGHIRLDREGEGVQ